MHVCTYVSRWKFLKIADVATQAEANGVFTTRGIQYPQFSYYTLQVKISIGVHHCVLVQTRVHPGQVMKEEGKYKARGASWLIINLATCTYVRTYVSMYTPLGP